MKILSALLSLHFRGLIQSHIPSLFVLNKQSMFLIFFFKQTIHVPCSLYSFSNKHFFYAFCALSSPLFVTEISTGGSTPRFVINGCSAASCTVIRSSGLITTSFRTKSIRSGSISSIYASLPFSSPTPSSIDVFATRTACTARTRALHEMSFDAQPPGCFSSGISRVIGGGQSRSPSSLNIDAVVGSSLASMDAGMRPRSLVISARCSRLPKKWRCVWKSGRPQPSSYAMQPRDHISHGRLHSRSRMTSGAR